MFRFLRALLCTLPFTAAPVAADPSFVWQIQGYTIACSDLTSLQLQAESSTPTGIHNLVAGCWLVEAGEMVGFRSEQAIAFDEERSFAIYRRAFSIKYRQNVFLLKKIVLIEFNI